ncbi:hypothetical protein HZZ09_03165 [Acinetobacter nosocomialis]|uniref:hypothetical protein n=2 Tax=Acinetobacter nosocomialis TaxID=106654 RepID=UPI001CC9872C|nr:hypothetical protein [Acinetobacter nosocomialis]MBZ6528937.1 hypothetical protein [Acinetobacter nosocomialis]
MSFNNEELKKLVLLKETAEIINNIRSYIYRDAKNLKNLNLGLNLAEFQVTNAFKLIAQVIIIAEEVLSSPELVLEECELYIDDLNNELYKALALRESTNILNFNLMLNAILFFIRVIAFQNFETKNLIEKMGYSLEINKIYNVLIKYIDNSNGFEADFYKKIIILEDKVNKIDEQNIINKEIFEKQVNKFFSEQKKNYDDNVDKIIKSFKSITDDLQYEYEREVKEKITGLKEDFESKRVELDALLGDVKLYQDKMTNKAVSEMSAHYFDKSNFERNSYFFLTFVSACIIIFSVYTAFVGVNSYYNQYVSTESCDNSEISKTKETIIPPVKLKSYEECMKDLTIKREATQKYAFNYLIFRLSFSLLLFLAVIYVSRIAMRAYNHWRQSENMYLKLNTLSPFIGSLDKPVRNDVHLSLVPDYFGKDAGIVENSKDAVKDIPTNISNIAIKAIEQAGSTIGSKLGSDRESKNSDSESSTEKNKKKTEDNAE